MDRAARWGPKLPFTVLTLVTFASLVHWTTPARLRLQWQAEERQCAVQLRQFYRALESYRRQNGEYPPHPLALYPSYLADTRLFICPAYHRGGGGRSQLVKTEYKGKSFSYTYYFPYLELLSSERVPDRERDKVSLIYCRVHAEVRYEANYRRSVGHSRKQPFIQRYGVPYVLYLREDGTIDWVDDLATHPSGQ